MNKGTLVYVDTLSAGDVADDFMEIHSESDTEDEVSDESADEVSDDNENSKKGRTNKKRMATWKSDFSLQQLFHAALEVRQLIKESKGVDSRWPPDSHDLTLALATKSIPIKLFNFLAWCLEFSCEPIEHEMVEICPSEKAKVVSMAQDLIYAESNGKKQTHKSLALGMTVRQMTGSVRLLKILHGLGHTASIDTVYRHDSALALASSNGQEIIISRNMNPEAFTTTVWDNNDFSEETLSGKGTTHVANGIIIQNEDIRLGEKTTVSKKHRTVKAPEINIVPYISKVRGTISLQDQSSDIPLEEDSYCYEQNMARNADFVYMLSRKCASEREDFLPRWTGFNTQAHKEIRRTSNIGYLLVIDAPVTDMATVNEILRHSVSICQRLLLPEIVLVFDEAIYSKAQMIRWKDEELKKRLVIRLGDFHTVMSFCTAIAKIFKDAGLQDIMIESEIVAPGSLKAVLSGKHYNRCVRAHKMIYEAMERLRFQAFEKTLATLEKGDVHTIDISVQEDKDQRRFMEICTSDRVIDIKTLYDQFIGKQSEKNPLFAFWSKYIEMVQLLLLYIRATRTSDWTLHLSLLRSMIAWFFATDRVNYSRYAPCYWLEMMCLNEMHPCM